MFVRKYIRRRADGTTDTYLLVARTYRQGKKVYQQQLCCLGKLEELQESGQLDRLIQGLARYSQQRWVVVDEITCQSENSP